MHRQGEPGVELEHVVRDARRDLLHRAEPASALLDHLEAAELEDVEAVRLRLGQSRARDGELGSPRRGRVEPDHEPSAGPLPAATVTGVPFA